MSESTRYLVVGGGVAAARAVDGIREHDADGPVTVLTVEDELPYERPPLSKGYLLGDQPRDEAFPHDAGWYEQNGVQVRTGTMVTSLDLAAREVVTEDDERVGYDRLLLATGSWPRRIDVPGADLEGVTYLRDLWEADALVEHLAGDGPVVVVGAGWIGLEVAAAARTKGLDVTVLDALDVPLQSVVGEQVGQVFADLHTEHGVTVLTGRTPERFEGEDGSVVAVVDSAGDRHEAAFVVVGIGADPQADWPLAAGLAGDGAIDVDASLRTSDPSVWAAGDVAAVDHRSIGRTRVGHWAWAEGTGRTAGESMAGADTTFEDLPFFFSDQYDLGLESVGQVDQDDVEETIVRGDLAGRAFQVFWVAGGAVRAGMHVNMWDDGVDPVKAVVARGADVDLARLHDESIPLADV